MNKQELIKDILDNYTDQMYDLKESLIALSETEMKSKDEILQRITELEEEYYEIPYSGSRDDANRAKSVTDKITALKWVLGED